MEHVDDNMDDLFRKAGERYPLKTTESDWDAVLGKLREEISGETGPPAVLLTQGNRNKSRWLLLLLLIPAAIFSLVYFSGSGIKWKTGTKTGTDKVTRTSQGRSLENNQASVSDRSLPSADQKADRQATAGMPTTRPVSSLKNKSAHQFAQTQNRPDAVNSYSKKDMYAPGAFVLMDMGKKSESNYTLSSTNAESFHEPVKKAIPLSVLSPNDYPSVYGMPFPPPPSVSIIKPNNGKGGSLTISKSDKSVSSKGMYAVLMGGPDISMVAFQSTKQMGYSLGILLGYRFNNRLSLESGLIWDKKYYYSTGQYFDKSKANFPPNINILNLNGNCNMFEIPLNLRYDFATRNNHGFFVTAGLSSYLMKKEYYDYSFTWNNNSNPYSRDSTYNQSSNYILSIIQLSAGYEHAIGRNTSIRVEPYLKIPLQGIGIGSMPISSVGLYLGISHSFR
jgi:hypothetical protein